MPQKLQLLADFRPHIVIGRMFGFQHPFKNIDILQRKLSPCYSKAIINSPYAVGATHLYFYKTLGTGQPFLARLAVGYTLTGRPYDEIA